jgi:MFS family permease
MPTFASTQLHLPLDQAFLAQSLALACMISIIPFSGALSDRVGRKPIFVSALTCYNRGLRTRCSRGFKRPPALAGWPRCRSSFAV